MIIFSDDTFDENKTSNDKLGAIIAKEYIKWTNGDPFVVDYNGNSLWTKPTARHFLTFFQSSPELVNFALHFIEIDDVRFGPVTKAIWESFSKEPYIWGKSIDFTICDEYKEYAKKTDFPSICDFLSKCVSLKERFSMFFYQEVILKLREEKDKLHKPDLVWVEKSVWDSTKKTINDSKRAKDYYEALIAGLKLTNHRLEDKCRGIPRDKTIIGILLPLVFIFLTWAVIMTGFFVAKTTKNIDSVSSYETTEQVGITVDNPQNKDIDLQVNN